MKNLFALALTAIVLFSACKKNNNDVALNGVFKGPEVTVGNGKAWSWIQVDNNNKPVSMGVSISSAAMNSLPDGNASHHGVPYLIQLPVQKNLTPFEHVGLDWNPHGHEPEFIYGASHFDFHFYMISETERMAIPAYEVDSAKFKNSPAAGFLPPMYMNFGGGVPQMGAHWVDVTSPELNQENPKPFTQTFIYGSF